MGKQSTNVSIFSGQMCPTDIGNGAFSSVFRILSTDMRHSLL